MYKSSSDHGAKCIKLDLVESEKYEGNTRGTTIPLLLRKKRLL